VYQAPVTPDPDQPCYECVHCDYDSVHNENWCCNPKSKTSLVDGNGTCEYYKGICRVPEEEKQRVQESQWSQDFQKLVEEAKRKNQARKPTSTGWKCPECGQVNSPSIMQCPCHAAPWPWCPQPVVPPYRYNPPYPTRPGPYWSEWKVIC
jgi:hypothetical protein